MGIIRILAAALGHPGTRPPPPPPLNCDFSHDVAISLAEEFQNAHGTQIAQHLTLRLPRTDEQQQTKFFNAAKSGRRNALPFGPRFWLTVLINKPPDSSRYNYTSTCCRAICPAARQPASTIKGATLCLIIRAAVFCGTRGSRARAAA